ncbi:hypothetical protein WISP_87061 [Willisornis vidua]|uniref:Uncharacterized protein n=1 Tax=Willisornis vidua TaxID=1566151 RepID=A0ABQ9D2Q1_9PASS|nr:hypothetical protein WISP_87061 [Willisornis vidua]
MVFQAARWKPVILPLYLALVRPPLECQVHFWTPQCKEDMDILERMQQRATMMKVWKHLFYKERLYMLSMMLYGIGYPLDQLGSAVPAVSPHHPLCTPSDYSLVEEQKSSSKNIHVLPQSLMGLALASSGSIKEPAGTDSVGHGGIFWQFLTQATPVAPPTKLAMQTQYTLLRFTSEYSYLFRHMARIDSRFQ